MLSRSCGYSRWLPEKWRKPTRRQKSEYPHSADGRSSGRDLWPKFSALLRNGALNGRTLHLALVVHDDPGVVLEVHKYPLTAPPGLFLADDDRLQNFLSQLR